ncbi:UNVERIFIED_CONTAM: Increased DNA methylation 1, partial [Sesamum latifolium]
MHKSVLAEDVLPEGTALLYVLHGEKKLEGYKKDRGIFCTCCREVVSPSQFEAHAGFASRRKPILYLNLGLLGLQEHDDLCSICEDGGDLLCCANCPRGFHTECVGLPAIPQGIWYCKYCQNMFEKEKFAEPDANALAARRVPGVDPLEAITQRCIRVVGTLELEIGGCAICRCHDFCKSRFTARTIIICDQCEKEYHVGCLKEKNIVDLKVCAAEGEMVLWQTVQQPFKVDWDGSKDSEALLDVLKMKCEGQSLQKNSELGIRWRLLRGKKATGNTRAWLSGAVHFFMTALILSLMPRRAVLTFPTYGLWEALQRPGFLGMYCAILMVDTVVVSATIFRIFGEEVAELPLVATRSECQGKGYFQSLLYCIEGLLASLNVKDLVLPAADEAESMWRNRFGFEKLGQEQ